VSDCALLARYVDGVLLVVSAHLTPRKQLETALNQLDANAVLGIVFNRDDRPVFGYRHSYYRGYFPQHTRRQ
jgi:Mrp family chromosome partitioning ATPase